MNASLDILLLREALRQGPAVPAVHDLIAWTPLFGEDGAILRDCAELIAGSSCTIQIGHRFASTDWTMEIAIAELEDAARRFTPLLNVPNRPRPSGRPDCVLGIGSGIPASDLPSDFAQTVRALIALLENQSSPDLEALTAHLNTLTELAHRVPTLDYRLLAGAPTDLLVLSIAASAVANFVLRIGDLADEPLGSPAFFHCSARFSPVGLGRWFSNVGRIVRTSRDVFDLARLACAASGRVGDEAVGAWIALLSRGCGGVLLRQLIDDLADYGAMMPLSIILDRSLSCPAAVIDIALVMYLRDAALDNGDYTLAARAQDGIVSLQPTRLIEQEILGAILASGGDLRGADATFRAALAVDPSNSGIRARLAALGTSAFAPFLINKGFGSPADRTHIRMHRRGINLSYTRRPGERITAVDVG